MGFAEAESDFISVLGAPAGNPVWAHQLERAHQLEIQSSSDGTHLRLRCCDSSRGRGQSQHGSARPSRRPPGGPQDRRRGLVAAPLCGGEREGAARQVHQRCVLRAGETRHPGAGLRVRGPAAGAGAARRGRAAGGGARLRVCVARVEQLLPGLRGRRGGQAGGWLRRFRLERCACPPRPRPLSRL